MKAYVLLNSHPAGSSRASCDKKLETVVQIYCSFCTHSLGTFGAFVLMNHLADRAEAGTLGISVLKRKWVSLTRLEKRLAGYASRKL